MDFRQRTFLRLASYRKKSFLVLIMVLLFLAAPVAIFWFSRSSLPWETESTPPSPPPINPVQAREDEADRTVWAKEILAERCGRVFEDLWDSINTATNKLELVAEFRCGEVLLPNWAPVQHLPHGIELHQGARRGEHMSSSQWRQYVQKFAEDGWRLENIEFRHNRFDANSSGAPAQSQFYFSAHLTNSLPQDHAMLEGDLLVTWGSSGLGEQSPPVNQIDGTKLKLKTRAGDPFFKKVFEASFTPPEHFPIIDPLIVYDLQGTGFPEILLPATNIVYARTESGGYTAKPLCRYPLNFIMSAVLADFDGDGNADLLCANFRGLFLFKGSPEGTFESPARQVWTASPYLKNAMVLTCGDANGDGALDIFLAQYKAPMLAQVLRPHYYDANDSWPSFLLINDGHGGFSDTTEASGLGQKRWRRTYTASFADLDGDGHPDLIVVSDFAGLDLYRNDGAGHFTDVTRSWVPEPHAFGMAHCLADFNADGREDLLMIGMPSPTVDRLQHLNLWRNYSTEDSKMRPAMTFGNRLLLGKSDGGFAQTSLSDSMARSGWSWGCSAFDFDNDGFPDLYVANGLRTNRSVRDYEGQFWLHSIFLDNADDVAASSYFMDLYHKTIESGWSYGGYEQNRLFYNQNGQSFTDIGHLAGVSLEEDSRDVVAADLDSDGKVDLVVTTMETWPSRRQRLLIYKNRLEDSGHWIGFRVREQPGASPVNLRAKIETSKGWTTKQIVTGDSHRSQHPNVIHFGLGQEKVSNVQIRWGNGKSLSLSNPVLDRYTPIQCP
jgi:enediyne biosynthesis protein E4